MSKFWSFYDGDSSLKLDSLYGTFKSGDRQFKINNIIINPADQNTIVGADPGYHEVGQYGGIRFVTSNFVPAGQVFLVDCDYFPALQWRVQRPKSYFRRGIDDPELRWRYQRSFFSGIWRWIKRFFGNIWINRPIYLRLPR